MTKFSRRLWFAFGIFNLGLGVAGAILPLLPAFPFLMLTLISFSKSSEKFHRWFLGTRLYRDNLQMYVEHHAMTWKVKIKVMITITFLMAIGFFIMLRKGVFIGDVVLCAVWIFHIILFCFIIKTLPQNEWKRLN